MDGVLIDSEPLFMEINKEIFAELGLDFEKFDHSKIVGMSSPNMWSKIKSIYNLNHDVTNLIEMEKSRVNNVFKSDKITKPMKDVTDLLEILKSKNYSLSVASSSAMKNIQLVLGKLDLLKYFTFIASGDDVTNSKPAPDIFLKVSEKLNVAVINCFVIEDSTNGVKAANAAGMHSIGFKNNNTNSQNITEADLIIQNFENENNELVLKFIESN